VRQRRVEYYHPQEDTYPQPSKSNEVFYVQPLHRLPSHPCEIALLSFLFHSFQDFPSIACKSLPAAGQLHRGHKQGTPTGNLGKGRNGCCGPGGPCGKKKIRPVRPFSMVPSTLAMMGVTDPDSLSSPNLLASCSHVSSKRLQCPHCTRYKSRKKPQSNYHVCARTICQRTWQSVWMLRKAAEPGVFSPREHRTPRTSRQSLRRLQTACHARTSCP